MKRLSAFLIFCTLLSGCAANKGEETAVSGTLPTSESSAVTEEAAEETDVTTSAAADTSDIDTKTEELTSTSETTSRSETTTAETTTAETTIVTSSETKEVTASETKAVTTSETKAVTAAETTVTAAETAAVTVSETQAVTGATATSGKKTSSTKKTQKTKKTTPETEVSTVKTEQETTTAETTAETTTEQTTAETAAYSEAVKPQADGSILIFGEKYTATFDDEFNGNELDLRKWSRCPEQKRQDRNCYWRDDRSYLNGEGQLVLEAVYDGDFLMGGIRSKGKFEQTYGYFEVKCTLNTTPGWWTAFWLMSDSVLSEENGGVDGTEIDIYESAYFKDSAVQHTLNWDGYGAAHKSLGSVVKREGLYDGGFHTFSLLWTPEEYVFFIDGEETWRTDAAEAEGVCTVPLYLKMTAETGSWTFADMDEMLLPDSILVDYIRVYEKSE